MSKMILKGVPTNGTVPYLHTCESGFEAGFTHIFDFESDHMIRVIVLHWLFISA